MSNAFNEGEPNICCHSHAVADAAALSVLAAVAVAVVGPASQSHAAAEHIAA